MKALKEDQYIPAMPTCATGSRTVSKCLYARASDMLKCKNCDDLLTMFVLWQHMGNREEDGGCADVQQLKYGGGDHQDVEVALV